MGLVGRFPGGGAPREDGGDGAGDLHVQQRPKDGCEVEIQGCLQLWHFLQHGSGVAACS